jgi:aromatic ring-opening dioxygenase catalytic subunit (LigB family)
METKTCKKLIEVALPPAAISKAIIEIPPKFSGRPPVNPFRMVSASSTPITIPDFSGFPDELYQIRYPAPGGPELAGRVQQLLAPEQVRSDNDWGPGHKPF